MTGRRKLGGLVSAVGEVSSDGWIRLNTNELSIVPSPGVLAAITNSGTRVNRYPHPDADPLRLALARHHGVDVSNIIVANGADGVLELCFRAFCDPGAKVGFLQPTYPFIRNLAEIFSASVVEAPSASSLLCADEQRVMTVLVNPNSPTGNWIEPAEIRAMMKSSGLLVLDEAYASFAPRSALELLDSEPEWLVVRTLSKSHGLAGLRVGYAVGSRDVIRLLRCAQNPYPVSSTAVEAGMAAIADDDYYAHAIASVLRERDRLTDALRSMGWRVDSSRGNFVFALPRNGDVRGVDQHLRSCRILVRVFDDAPDGLRISIGSQSENDELIAALGLIS